MNNELTLYYNRNLENHCLTESFHRVECETICTTPTSAERSFSKLEITYNCCLREVECSGIVLIRTIYDLILTIIRDDFVVTEAKYDAINDVFSHLESQTQSASK